MARRPIVHIQVWPNARERRVVERLVKQTRISGGTFSGCGARFSVPPQASACGEPARRAEARRRTLKRAPRGTARPFTYTQMYSHRFFHMTKYTTTRATYVAAQNQGVHHAMPSMRKSEIGQRNRVA